MEKAMGTACCDECGTTSKDMTELAVQLPSGIAELKVCNTCFMAYAMTHSMMNAVPDDVPFSA